MLDHYNRPGWTQDTVAQDKVIPVTVIGGRATSPHALLAHSQLAIIVYFK